MSGDRRPPVAAARLDRRAPRASMFWWVAVALTITFMGPNLPTVLYVRYQHQWAFSASTLTVVFAVYAVALLATLLFFGGASDQAGRRPIMAGAIALGVLRSVVFIVANGVALLFLARALSGLSAGVVTGAAAAALSELARPGASRRASLVTTAVTMGGLALAPLMSGLLVQYAPQPTRLVFYVYIALLLVAACGVYVAPETVTPSSRPQVHFEGLGVPAGARVRFLSAGIAAFCSFTPFGAVRGPGTLVPRGDAAPDERVGGRCRRLSDLRDRCRSRGAAPRDAQPPRRARRVRTIGLWPLGDRRWSVVQVVAGVHRGHGGRRVWGGFVYVASLALVNLLAPPEHRSQVISTYFVAANLGLIIPVIGVGTVSQYFGDLSSTIVCAAAITLLVVVAVGNITRSRPSTSTTRVAEGAS
ncbi:MAG: MFS transporter [Actinomycetota bacterium]|nr:MFS transporter [Actinomycetota bacterium]